MSSSRATAQGGSNGRVLKTAPEPPPTSAFMSWLEIGQKVCGTVENVGEHRWPDKPDDPVPELTLVLAAPTFTFREGKRVDLEAGCRLTMTLSLWHLAPQIEDLNPQPGLYLEIEYIRNQGRTKIFKVNYDDSNVAPAPGKPVRLSNDERSTTATLS
jgi:hypothetical protein